MEALKKLAARSSYDVPVGRAVLVGLQSPTYEAVHDPLTHLEVVAKDVAKLVEKMCEERHREHRPQEEELKEVLPAIGSVYRNQGLYPEYYGNSGGRLS